MKEQKDRWDKAQIAGTFVTAVLGVIISGFAAYFSWTAANQVNAFNTRQADLTSANLLREYLQAYREPVSKTGSGEKMAAVDSNLSVSEWNRNAEWNRIALASIGKDALPVVQMMLASSEPGLQVEGEHVAAYLFNFHPAARESVSTQCLTGLESHDVNLRRGCMNVLIRLKGRIENGRIVSTLTKRFPLPPVPLLERDRAVASSACRMLGDINSSASFSAMVGVLRSSAPDDVMVHVQCLTRMATLWHRLNPAPEQTREWTQVLEAAAVGWNDRRSLDEWTRLKTRMGLQP